MNTNPTGGGGSAFAVMGFVSKKVSSCKIRDEQGLLRLPTEKEFDNIMWTKTKQPRAAQKYGIDEKTVEQLRTYHLVGGRLSYAH